MVRNSRLIFFHVVSLAVPGSPALLWQGQGQSAPGTGEFPVPCRGARGCRGAVPSPLCRQAGRRPVSMVSIRRLAELTPTQGSYNQQSHPFCLQNHLSSCTKAETNQNQLWPCPLPQGTHTLCLCLLGCLQPPWTVLGNAAACQQHSPLQRHLAKLQESYRASSDGE